MIWIQMNFLRKFLIHPFHKILNIYLPTFNLMLSIDQCRAILNNPNLSDQEIENIRNLLYSVCTNILKIL